MAPFHIVWTVFLFALGACVGSFLNVVIYRLPRDESIVFPGSHCPSCGRPILWYHNIPLVSWFLLRGRCRWCRASISPRYPLIEAATALLTSGLYVCYYVLEIRDGLGSFSESWLTYSSHAALWCGLLVCATVDIEYWIVPLEVCCFVSAVGMLTAGAIPPSGALLPRVSPVAGAMGLAAAIGLIVSVLLTRRGLLRPSFIDAEQSLCRAAPGRGDRQAPAEGAIVSVGVTKNHGVNPRLEVLRELLYLAPALALAAAAYAVLSLAPPVGSFWRSLMRGEIGPWWLTVRLEAFQAALVGYLVGGLWVWGLRILGTLAFGKEAMGLGDVHLMAAVGAVAGWIVPSVAFFVAPVLGLLWAVKLLLFRRQRELPYGPWLALACGLVMLCYDGIMDAFRAFLTVPGGSY